VTLRDCLDMLMEHGFETRTELEDSLIDPHDGEAAPTDPRVANIVMEFKRAPA
jgi:hypothetical protein